MIPFDRVHIRQCKSEGFTLIEMAVVVAIIGILAVVISIRWASIKMDNELDISATLLESALQEMKQKTLAPKPSTSISEESNLNGYGVRFHLSDNGFSGFADMVDNGADKIFCENRYVNQGSPYCEKKDVVGSSSSFNNFSISDQVKIIKVEGIDSGGNAYEDANVLSGDDDLRYKSIVMTVNELPSSNVLWYGDRSCDCWAPSREYQKISIIIEHQGTKKIKKVTIDFVNNLIYTE